MAKEGSSTTEALATALALAVAKVGSPAVAFLSTAVAFSAKVVAKEGPGSVFPLRETPDFLFLSVEKCKDSVQKIFCYSMYISTLHIKTAIQKIV